MQFSHVLLSSTLKPPQPCSSLGIVASIQAMQNLKLDRCVANHREVPATVSAAYPLDAA